jgi:acetate---CoA ligase (ADP-forming)
MSDLSRLVTPRSVAIVGASSTPGTPGHDAFRNVVQHSDLAGETYLVNPRRTSIEGHPCLPDVESLPDDIDTAMVLVNTEAVVETVGACGRKGIKFAIVPAAGLGETGEAGRQVEAALRETARSTGIRVYGTNCPGLSNINDRVLLSISPSAQFDTLRGTVGLVTHGGGPGRNFLQYMDRGLGVGCWLSGGNEVDLDVADFIEYLTEDPRIRVIACIIEGLRDGRRFLRAAAQAGRTGKPVVVLHAGRSQQGAVAAQSHTAHLASPGRVMTAALRQNGVIVVRDMDELVEHAALLARPWPRSSIRPCVLSFSGGAAVSTVDALAEQGFTLPEFSMRTKERLARVLPTFAAPCNPLDLTMEVFRRPEILPAALEILGDEPAVNALVVPIPADYGSVGRRISEGLTAHAADRPDTWLVPAWTSPRMGEGHRELADHGFYPFTRLSNLALALRNVEAFENWRRPAVTEDPPAPPQASVGIESRHDEWSEAAGKELLAAQGIAVPEGAVAGHVDEAVSIADRIGFPVVLKAHSRSILHKSEIGGVHVGLGSEDEVRSAWTQMEASVTSAGHRFEGTLVEGEAPDGLDAFVSVRRDALFGHVLTLGLGGVFSEIFDDVAFAVEGVTDEALLAELRRLRSWPLFAGFRGTAPVDIRELVRVSRALESILARSATLSEIELNPLRLFPDGALALDVIVSATAEADPLVRP